MDQSPRPFFYEAKIRVRLFRKLIYRLWKWTVLADAKSYIYKINDESKQASALLTPAIVLSTFSRPLDFLILFYLFQEKELTFISPRNLPFEKNFLRLSSIARMLHFDGLIGYSFFRKLLAALRDFNRSVVISPQAISRYAGHIPIDFSVVARIAMAANVPIITVIMKWQNDVESRKGCQVQIRKKVYVSPRSEEFKDVFFKQKGLRKFRKLPKEDLTVIGQRIFSMLEQG
ncbi:MAG: hypothetical protein V1882_00790 [Candidatus Omnitrophota bacterium]